MSKLNDIENLDALGREYGFVIYSVQQCNAGWGTQWYEGEPNPASDSNWRRKIVVYQYYPTITEMVIAETARINAMAKAKAAS